MYNFTYAKPAFLITCDFHIIDSVGIGNVNIEDFKIFNNADNT